MTTDQIQYTPTQHSRVVGGSTASRVIACPASVKLVDSLPETDKDVESVFAKEGTALHNAIEHILMEGWEPEDLPNIVGMEFYGVTMTQDLLDTCLAPAYIMFWNTVAQLEETDGELLCFSLENSLEYPDIDGAMGTLDVLLVTPKRSVIWDWKFGGGVPVSAYRNKQLMFYAVAAAASEPEKFFPSDTHFDWDTAPDDWTVHLFICQPRLNPDEPSGYASNIGELAQFHLELCAAVDLALGEDTPPFRRGEHCRWCAAAAICPSYVHTGQRLAALLNQEAVPASNGEAAEAVVPLEQDAVMDPEDYRLITPEILADMLEKADMLDFWTASVRKLAMSEALAGRPPKGMKLVKKLSNLSYVSDSFDSVDKMLANKGLDVKERRKVTNITPTQANKLLKAKGAKLLTEKQAARFENGTALVAESDPREPVNIPSTLSEEKKRMLGLA